MEACIDRYLDKHAFLIATQAKVLNLCKAFMNGDWVVDERDKGKALAYCLDLEQSLRAGDQATALHYLVKVLYVFRNGRIHGRISTTRAMRGIGIVTREMPITVLPEIILELCIHLISGKTKMSRVEIEEIIKSRERQLIDEIKSNLP